MSAEDLDKLFRDSLKNRPVAPSNEAWERLQARMQPAAAPQLERKPIAMWYYSAAAAVTLLLGIGFWTVKDEINFSQPQATVAKVNPSTKQTAERIRPTEETTATYSTGTKASSQPEVLMPATQPVVNNQVLAVAGKNNSGTQATSPRGVASSKVETLDREVTTKKDAFMQKPEMVATARPTYHETEETSTASAVEPLEVTVILSNAEPVALAQATPADETVRNSSLATGRVLKGIMKQVKNLKDGEKISLSELGITKQTFAFESRIGNKKISKSIQL